MSGAIKFNQRASGARLFLDHERALQRLADSGRDWARRALQKDAALLFVSADGFKESFWEVAEEAPQQVITWTLDDLW